MHIPWWRGVAAFLLVCSLAAAVPTAIVGATAVTLDGDEVVRDAVVLVDDGRITAVGPRDRAAIPADALRVDGTGAFLVPGLCDMHVHSGERGLALFVANGVTTIRELSGTAAHLRWREEIAAGRRVGPRLIVFSPLLTTEKQPAAYRIVADAAAAGAAVEEFVGAGYDGLKLYDGLSAETYAAFITAARERGLRTTGHIPDSVGWEAVLAAGQSLEHAEKFVVATAGFDLDREAMQRAIARLGHSGVWLTPTLAVHEVLAGQGTPRYAERLVQPEMAWVAASTMAWWNALRGSRTDSPNNYGNRFLAMQRELTLAAARGGTRLLAGTDTPNPGMVPGFSLHDELDALVRAGLSPREVLAAATTAPASYLGEEGRAGVLKVGARADFVLVAGDPREDLSVLRKPLGVMLAGRWLDRAALDRLLEEARPKPAAK